MAKTAALTPYDRIQALRAQANPPLSQRALCDKAGVASNTLATASTTKSLKMESVQAFARALGVTTGQLLGEAPSPATDLPRGAAAGTTVRLSLRQLITGPLNPRKTFDPAAIAELADNIAARGLLQNLIVRPFEANGAGTGHTVVKTKDLGDLPMYEVVAGERRYRALCLLAERAAWNRHEANVECRVIGGDAAEHLATAIIENLQREQVAPMEEAEAFAQLHGIDPKRWSTANIATAIGKTARFVQMRLALANKLEAPTREALNAGRITVEQARSLTMAKGPVQTQALQAVLRNDFGYRSDREIAERIRAGLPKRGWEIFDPDLYTGEMVEDDGVTYYADRAEFDRLQSAAVKARIEALKAEGHAFVATQPRNFVDWPYQETTRKGRKGVGIVILLCNGGKPEERRCINRQQEAQAKGAKAAEKQSRKSEAEAAARAAEAKRLSAWHEDLFAALAAEGAGGALDTFMLAAELADMTETDLNPLVGKIGFPGLTVEAEEGAEAGRFWDVDPHDDDALDLLRAGIFTRLSSLTGPNQRAIRHRIALARLRAAAGEHEAATPDLVELAKVLGVKRPKGLPLSVEAA